MHLVAPGFMTRVLSLCHGWLLAGCAYKTTPTQKPQTLTLKCVSLGRKTLHMSLSFAAKEKAHPVQPWRRLVPDLPGLPDAYLLPAAFVLYSLL